MNWLVPLLLLITPLFVCSCNNSNKNDERRIGHLNEVDEAAVYFDYRVMAEEGDDNLTIMLQYRDGGPDGSSIIVDVSGKVELDGKRIPVDSSGLTGAYYELQQPIGSFIGKHSIVFSHGRKNYKEEFNFEPMVLKTEIPDTIDREELVLELGGLEPEDYVRILLFDTTARDEINRLDTVVNGQVILGADDLGGLSKGDLHLELHREFERPVQNGTRKGGRIYIGYVIKRKLFLRD